MTLQRLGLAAAQILAGIWFSSAQGAGPFGPKDGFDLPATDLERVKLGDQAPDFTLESRDGRAITLSAFRGKKNVILVFYRGHW